MLRNYLTIALRHLLRDRGYAVINILGLAIGIACCILIFLYVRHEWTYDAFHEKADRIYRVNLVGKTPDGETYEMSISPIPLAPALSEQFPEISRVVRLRGGGGMVVRRGDRMFREEGVLFTDSLFFDMFSFRLRRGDPATALKDKDTVVISRTAADRYFGGDVPQGARITIDDDEMIVTGVVEDIPGNSSIRFDFLIPYAKMRDKGWWSYQSTSWNSSSTYTFIELMDPAQTPALEERLPGFVETHFPEEYAPGLSLQPLTAIHLNPDVRYSQGSPSDPKLSYILAGIAFLILLIACINFMNLAIGRSSTRAREVGMRKVLGAQRTQIMRQFWGEAILLCGFALALGVVLAHLFLPTFNALADKNLVLDYHTSGSTLLALIGGVGLAVLIAGGYPALILSGFNPVSVLKNQLRIGGANLFTRSLVVVQFALSVLLIICTLIMFRQLDYIRNQGLGFNQEQVAIIRAPWNISVLDVFRNAISSYDDILQVTGASASFGPDRGGEHGTYIDKERNIQLTAYTFRVDYDYVKTLGLELVDGRDFSREFVGDAGKSSIINQAAVRDMGWEEPIGQKLPQGTTVVGVVKDYHFQSLHEAIAPVVMHLNSGNVSYIMVRISGKNIPATLALLEDKWQEAAPLVPFEYYFLDEDIDRFYRSEARFSRIATYSALFAVFIACMGGFGLITLAVTRRTREIGIRKVMGATVPDIVLLLAKEYVRLVVIANILIWPLAYWVMSRWLQNFAYRVEIGPGAFVTAGVLALVIALLTVGYQAVKAALANPVDALRYE